MLKFSSEEGRWGQGREASPAPWVEGARDDFTERSLSIWLAPGWGMLRVGAWAQVFTGLCCVHTMKSGQLVWQHLELRWLTSRRPGALPWAFLTPFVHWPGTK